MSVPLWQELLDDESAAVAEALALLLPEPLHTLGVEGVRAATATVDPPRLPALAVVRDHGVEPFGMRVREYRSEEQTLLPAVLYMHGGGFVVGSLDGVDEVCRVIAAAVPCAVFSVEYRLAPEHPYPAALDDVRAAHSWLMENAAALGVDETRVAVAGDSAGGGLAASLCLDLRDRGEQQPVLQLLVYPPVGDSLDRDSWRDFADAPVLGTADAWWFWQQYVGESGRAPDALAAPLTASSMAGLAPAHVITAEVDPLRDDAEAYAERLSSEGVPVTSRRYLGVFHGFFTEVQAYTKARQALEDACAVLRGAFDL